MKTLFGLTILFFSINSFAVTWSYKITEADKAPGPEYKIDSPETRLEIGSTKCAITATEIRDSNEFRAVQCKVGAAEVATTVTCGKGGFDYGNLHIYKGKSYYRIVLGCDGL